MHKSRSNKHNYKQKSDAGYTTDGWIGLGGLSDDQLDRQIASSAAKLEALRAELASRAASRGA
jgi:hypothetical protein